MPTDSTPAAKELYEAMKTCSYVRTSRLLNHGVSPDTRLPGFEDTYPGRPGMPLRRSGLVPLHYAAFWRAKKSQLKLIQRLLDAGADVRSADDQGYTPLHDSVYDNDPEPVRLLLEAGADADATTALGFTPLHLAALDGAGKAAELLLARGGKVNATANEGETPLAFAAMSGDADQVRQLLQAGAKVNAREADGMTPLLRAAYYSSAPAVLHLLAEAGADLRATSGESGAGALHYAATAGWQENIRTLLELGAELNARDARGTTPLLRAVAMRQSACVEQLLEAGADTDFQGDKGVQLCCLALAGKVPAIISSVEKACPEAMLATRRRIEKAARNSRQKKLLYLGILFLTILYYLLSCSPEPRTCTYAEAQERVNTPATMYRGTDYLGSDAEYHYFEYKMEASSDTRFRIPRADCPLPEPYSYSAWFPERREAHDVFRTSAER